MSEHGHIDQMDGDTMAEARVYVGVMEPDLDAGPNAMSDAEVLAYLDENYPGGAAQLNREQTMSHYGHPTVGGGSTDWDRANYTNRSDR